MHQGLVPAPATAKQQLDHILHSKLPVAREEGPIKGLSKLIKAVSDEQLIGAGLQPPAVPQLCLHSIAEDQPLTARLQAVQVRVFCAGQHTARDACLSESHKLALLLHAMQSFISAFEYNQCIGYNHNVLKQRPLQAILATAAGILAHPLPIKCIGEPSCTAGPATMQRSNGCQTLARPSLALARQGCRAACCHCHHD